MNIKNCQCTPKPSGQKFNCSTSARVFELSHKRARLPAVLRYRGLDDEAEKASWMLDIETNLAALQEAVTRLDSSMASLVSSFSESSNVKRR